MTTMWWSIAVLCLLGLLGALMWWIAVLIPKKPRGKTIRKH